MMNNILPSVKKGNNNAKTKKVVVRPTNPVATPASSLYHPSYSRQRNNFSPQCVNDRENSLDRLISECTGYNMDDMSSVNTSPALTTPTAKRGSHNRSRIDAPDDEITVNTDHKNWTLNGEENEFDEITLHTDKNNVVSYDTVFGSRSSSRKDNSRNNNSAGKTKKKNSYNFTFFSSDEVWSDDDMSDSEQPQNDKKITHKKASSSMSPAVTVVTPGNSDMESFNQSLISIESIPSIQSKWGVGKGSFLFQKASSFRCKFSLRCLLIAVILLAIIATAVITPMVVTRYWVFNRSRNNNDEDGNNSLSSSSANVSVPPIPDATISPVMANPTSTTSSVVLTTAPGEEVVAEESNNHDNDSATATDTDTAAITAPPTTAVTRPPTLGEPTTPPPTPPSTDIFESDYARGLKLWLQNYSPLALLDDPSTPQGLAYRWLVQEDKMKTEISHIGQRYALVTLAFAVTSGGSSAIEASTARRSAPITLINKYVHECNWYGITCSNQRNGGNNDGQVVTLNWARQELTGYVTGELSILAETIQHVDLAQNALKGDLDVFWELKRLQNLYLFENQFSGSISSSVNNMRRLKKLYLGHNQLTGSIPSAFGGMGKPLEYLILHHNKLSGRIPHGLRLRDLEYLDLSYNRLQGNLPTDWIQGMISLRHLYLDHNRLSGQLPDYFSYLGNGRLKQFYINDNRLTGGIPTNWGDMNTLTNMNIENNNFAYYLSDEICEMSIFNEGELVELKADCDICTCESLCFACV